MLLIVRWISRSITADGNIAYVRRKKRAKNWRPFEYFHEERPLKMDPEK